nr:reverse transcriptase domain-containing protein [Tanacetum cinerariifolium]
HPELPNTTVKLLLFPFSLEGEARIWLDKEPPRSILTWEDLVSKFINQFFPPSKTTYLGNEITNFLQKSNETFNEAWERFKDLLRQCPHHGFSELHQLDTFYNALNPNDQDALDSAIAASLEDKLEIRMNRFEKSLNEIKNSFITPTAPLKAAAEPAERRNRIEKSLQNFRVIHKSSISLNTSQISSIHEVAPILSTREPENSLSMGYEHLSITPETEYDVVTESNAKNLLPIPSECEVTLEDKRECNELICENSSTIDVCDNHSEILFDSNNDDISVYDDDVSSDDESFEDIEYVDASVLDPAIVSVEEENVVQREEEEVDLEDISQVQDVVLREKLFSITRLISNIESLNENSTPDCVFNSFEFDNSLLDNYSPEFKTFCDNLEETRSDNTTHVNYSLPEYDSFHVEIEPDQERLINL